MAEDKSSLNDIDVIVNEVLNERGYIPRKFEKREKRVPIEKVVSFQNFGKYYIGIILPLKSIPDAPKFTINYKIPKLHDRNIKPIFLSLEAIKAIPNDNGIKYFTPAIISRKKISPENFNQNIVMKQGIGYFLKCKPITRSKYRDLKKKDSIEREERIWALLE